MSLHSFPPVARSDARVLILGSMPGGESLRRQQYYAHPRNAFWQILGSLFGFDPDLPYPERLNALKCARIALWDTLAGCERSGSLDSNIRDPEPNDITGLLRTCPEIRTICCNGTASFGFLRKYHPALFMRPNLEILRLPSTSPAAALYSFEEKRTSWTIVKERADAETGR